MVMETVVQVICDIINRKGAFNDLFALLNFFPDSSGTRSFLQGGVRPRHRAPAISV